MTFGGVIMAEKFNLQDRFLNTLRIQKIEVKIFLEGGFQTKGIVKSFDNFTVLLENENEQALVYKHAIKMMEPIHFSGNCSRSEKSSILFDLGFCEFYHSLRCRGNPEILTIGNHIYPYIRGKR